MIKQVRTILCWVLAISLVWLPLSVSAGISLPPTEKKACHEMNSAISDQAAVMVGSKHESMMQKNCCDNCDNNCVACTSMTSCGQSSNHVSACIVFNKDISLSQKHIQFSIEHFVQYRSQIISPDIRPPLV